MNNRSECNPRAVLAVNEQEKIMLDKKEKIYKNNYQVSQTAVNLAGLLRPLIRLSPRNPCGSINKKSSKHLKCYCGHVAPYKVNVAFKSSRDGEQAIGEKVPIAGLIDNPLNWTTVKAVELESSGGAR